MTYDERFDCEGGAIVYRKMDDGIHVRGFSGRILSAVIPDDIDGIPFSAIDKKALFGAKALRRLSLPGTIQSIGEWAIASCDNLEEITFRKKPDSLIFAQGALSKNNGLRSLDLNGNKTMASLLAVAPGLMNAEYLLDQKAVENAQSFYDQWDRKLLSILGEADDDGFVFMVLCGEEDLSADIDEYKEMRRSRKAELCLLRLLNDEGLTEEFRMPFLAYVQSHTCGCESEAAFSVLVKLQERDESYRRLLFDTEMIDENNFEKILKSLGDRHAQFKAEVLKWHEPVAASTDFFDSLML